MNFIASYKEALSSDSAECGGKAAALGFLQDNDFIVPEGFCITCRAYREYVSKTGLNERIMMELKRKSLDNMRWEEVWDSALRIRNMFLRTPLPPELSDAIAPIIEKQFGNNPVAVRSSAPGEDSGSGSFAGLHSSFVNLCGTEAILEHIKLVWSSLWSDAALLYRKELELDVFSAAMAVIVQKLVHGHVSGVAFSKDPAGADCAVIEAVYGLNQGLVDGTVQPDRWHVSRSQPPRITTHHPVSRESTVVPVADGVCCMPLPSALAAVPPLENSQVLSVYDKCMKLEDLCGTPQDMEWTIAGEKKLVLLQARPITTGGSDPEDKRVWYRSLSRTFDNLKKLRKKIEKEIVPGMLRAASEMAAINLSEMNDQQLADEILRRNEIHKSWIEVYWEDLIPFAHGVRLFGQYYNDVVRPANPYEFVELLGNRDFKSLNRNDKLEKMAVFIRRDDELRKTLMHDGDYSAFEDFNRALNNFLEEYGDLSSPLKHRTKKISAGMKNLLLQIAARPERQRHISDEDISRLTAQFAMKVPPERVADAMQMLDLARVSYNLRDDDNVYLHGVETQFNAAMIEGRRRLDCIEQRLSVNQICAMLRGEPIPENEPDSEHSMSVFPVNVEGETAVSVSARQLIGQPSSPGLANGKARVITCHEDLAGFSNGEILVCDAISPTMTFVVPLAGAIVERRGGMLIHGAIIAREYGIPCVTGVDDAVAQIKDGANLTVDGFLGIVRIG